MNRSEVVEIADSLVRNTVAGEESVRLIDVGVETPGVASYTPSEVTSRALLDADVLLDYAAKSGRLTSPEIIRTIAEAKISKEARSWTSKVETDFWAAYSSLNSLVSPATVESLSPSAAASAMHYVSAYSKLAWYLIAFIIPLSLIIFVNTSISNDISDLVKQNDIAALTLRDRLSGFIRERNTSALDDREQSKSVPPGTGLDDELGQFTRVNRLLYARTQLLNVFVLWAGADPHFERRALELLPAATASAAAGMAAILQYQDIRAFSKDVQQRNLVGYGSIAAYLLPVLYALLGACAYALRSLSEATLKRSYLPSVANFARIIVALIAGVVIGLFTNFTKEISLSPLAIAFLVGYAVEIFFTFLDSVMQPFRRD